MVIAPKTKGFICLTAHPQGCAVNVRRQIEHVRAHSEAFSPGRVRNALVIGATTGYGLASALCAGFGCNAHVLGIGFEKNAQRGRTATAGFYNAEAWLCEARKAGLQAHVIMGDAFSDGVKQLACAYMAEYMGKIDLVIYSLAAPVRIHPETGARLQSVIKPIGAPYVSKSVRLPDGEVVTVELQPADEAEVESTVAVMGGDDWRRWIDALTARELLSDDALTLAYSYIGPELTHPIYRDGTIGKAKEDLKATADRMLAQPGLPDAYISVNKALVTQASSAIPVVPLYISMLARVMEARGTQEGCIEQMTRLFGRLSASPPLTDAQGCIRMDDLEMAPDVQQEITRRWAAVDSQNIRELADLEGYQTDFLRLFGFMVDGVDYEADVSELACEDGMTLV